MDHLGRILAVAGGIALSSGAVTTFAAPDSDARRAGLTLGGAGLLGILVGIPMQLLSGTRVRFN